jgi:deoxyribose-phosphate aldolase
MSAQAPGPGHIVCASPDVAAIRPGGPLLRARRTLTVGQVAARLEHRLYTLAPTPRAVQDGCALAVRLGLANVIARPEAVPAVGLHVAGTSVGLVTIPGWHDDEVDALTTKELLAEARRLVDGGATDLGMLADVGRLEIDHGRQFAHDVSALAEEMRASGARVRVVIDTDGMPPDALVAACHLMGVTGAWLVQGGSWRGTARTGLSRVQLMRAALPSGVRLKWTFPVRSLDSMMICIAEGVDLFNGDPAVILREAERRSEVSHLVVPDRACDY